MTDNEMWKNGTKSEEEHGGYRLKFHFFNGKYYADVFLVTGGYCIVQHSDKTSDYAYEKALSWIELRDETIKSQLFREENEKYDAMKRLYRKTNAIQQEG